MEADEALRVLEDLRHLLDRKRRRVGCEDRIRANDLLNLTENLLLDADLLKHGLDHEIGIRVHTLIGASRDEALDRASILFLHAATLNVLSEVARNVIQASLSALLIHVRHDHRNLQLLSEHQRKLSRHEPSTDHADLRDFLRLNIGHTCRTLSPGLEQLEERVDRVLERRREHEVRELVDLKRARFLLSHRTVRIQRIQKRGRGRTGLCVGCLLDQAASVLECGIPAGGNLRIGRILEFALSLRGCAIQDRGGPLERILQEVLRPESDVRATHLSQLAAVQEAVALERVFKHDLQAVFDAHQAREAVDATPTRDQAEARFRQAERAH